MLNLPLSTEINKKIPKQKFYENITISTTLKRVFIDQIKGIYWRNKIAATTVNVSKGEVVTEIEVFEIILNQQSLNVSVLQQIDKEIPYHLIFILSYENSYQIYIGYKERKIRNSQYFKVDSYFHTDWLNENDINQLVKLDGINMDLIYENYVRQVAGDKLQSTNEKVTLKEQLRAYEEKQKILKQIEKLEKKARNEKQPHRKYELFQEIQRLKRKL